MDGGRRLAEPVTGPARSGTSGAEASQRRQAIRRGKRRVRPSSRAGRLGYVERWVNNRIEKIAWLQLPPGVGLALSAFIILTSATYGTIRGGHVPAVLDYVRDLRDMAGNAAGFAIAGVVLDGHKHLTREEILAVAGITGRSSLLFLDVADARDRLKANPWIADAAVQKLYPDRLQISMVERQAFALWQKNGRVAVIAADGTVLELYVARRFASLPLVVGEGADSRAKEFLALIDSYPDIRAQLRAAVLVAGRRWNLRLKNGMDVRLPEADVARALDQLVSLGRDKNVFSRDIASIDLRLPDRVTVRLSDGAAQAREDALKAKKAKAKGGSA